MSSSDDDRPLFCSTGIFGGSDSDGEEWRDSVPLALNSSPAGVGELRALSGGSAADARARSPSPDDWLDDQPLRQGGPSFSSVEERSAGAQSRARATVERGVGTPLRGNRLGVGLPSVAVAAAAHSVDDVSATEATATTRVRVATPPSAVAALFPSQESSARRGRCDRERPPLSLALLAAAAAQGLASDRSRLADMDRARSAVARAKMLRESPLYAEHFDERTVAACRELFSGDVSTTITSKKAAAARRGLTTQAWGRSKLRMATAMVELKRGEAAASFALTRALAEAHPAQVVPLLDISYRSYDETATKFRVHGEGSSTAKVLQSQVAWATLTRFQLLDERVEYLFVRGNYFTTLQVTERTTGECGREAIERQCPNLYDSVARRKVHVVVTDDAGSNNRMEDAILREPPPRRAAAVPAAATSSLHLKCAVHKTQEVVKRPSEMMSETVSGVLNLGLSMRASGCVSLFRRILSEEVGVRARVLVGAAPAAATRRRLQLISVFCARGGRARKQLACVLALLTNGDWSVRGEIQHYCSPTCCPGGRDETVLKLRRYLIPALSGRAFYVFARNRWQGGYRALDQQGVFESLHGLLGIAYSRFAVLMASPIARSGSLASIDSQPQRRAATDAADTMENTMENSGDLALVPAPAHDAFLVGDAPRVDDADFSQSVAAAAVEGAGEDIVDHWRKMQSAYRRSALTYLRPGGMAADRLVLLRIVCEPQTRLMDAMLHLGSVRWECEQLRVAKNGGARAYRVAELASGVLVAKCMREISSCIRTPRWPLSPEAHTTSTRSLIFRLAARSAAAAEYYLVRPHSGFPYKLFLLLRGSVSADDVLASRRCLRDSFTDGFLTDYPTAELIGSGDALATLRAVAAVADTDIAARECGHAHVRRLKEARSVQTHVASIDDISADFVAQQSRRDRRSWYGRPRDAVTRGARPTSGEEAPAATQQRRPRKGGGAWRAFLHVKAQGGRGLPDVRALAQEYRALSPAAMARYVVLGQMGTRALQSGAERAFALTPAQVRKRAAASERERLSAEQSCSHRDQLALPPVGSSEASEQCIKESMAAASRWCTRDTREASLASERTRSELQTYAASGGSARMQALLACVPDLQGAVGTAYIPLPHEDPALLAHAPDAVDDASLAVGLIPRKRDAGLGRALDAWWGSAHGIIMHAKCRPILGKTTRRPCFDCGYCVCTRQGRRRRKLLNCMMRNLKRSFPKPTARQLLMADGAVVVRLRAFSEDSGCGVSEGEDVAAVDRWFSLPLVVLSPQNLVMLELEEPTFSATLPNAIDLSVKFGPDGCVVLRSAHAVLDDFALGHRVRMSTYRLVGDEETQPTADLCAATVQVVLVADDAADVVIWGGDDGKGRPRKRRTTRGGRSGPRPLVRRVERALRGPARRSLRDDECGASDCPSEVASSDASDSSMGSSASSSVSVDGDNSSSGSESPAEESGSEGSDTWGLGSLFDEAESVDSEQVQSGADVDSVGETVDPSAHVGDEDVIAPADFSFDLTDAESGGEPEPPVDILAPSAADAVPEPPAARFPGVERMAAPRVDFGDGFGARHSIRYDASSGQLVAYCGIHGRSCRKQRTTNASRKPGSGRPLGWLAAWLLAGHQSASRDEHFYDVDHTLASRVAGRALVAASDGGDVLAVFEAPRLDIDPEEPLEFQA